MAVFNNKSGPKKKKLKVNSIYIPGERVQNNYPV